MKTVVYLLIKNPLKKSDLIRFNIDLLMHHFNLYILDCSEWLLPESHKVRTSDKIELNNIFNIKNVGDLKKILITQNAYALDFIGLFSIDAITLFRILKKNNTKIIVVDSGPYPSPGPTKSSQSFIFKIKIVLKNKLIQRFLYARILNLYKICSIDLTPDLAMVSGNSWKTNPRFSNAKKIIPSHSFDYETFLKINSLENTNPNDYYAVYLDENISNHEDNAEMNLATPVSGIFFLNKLEIFFQYIEQKLNLKVKIAAYPSTDINLYSEVFKNREIVTNNTATLIKNSNLVFAHASTAISFSVLWKKPTIFITDNDLIASWYYADIESAKNLLNSKKVNIDNQEEIDATLKNWDKFSLVSYEDYQNTYIKSKGSSNEYLWDILSKEIN
jgi:hypothetical protein